METAATALLLLLGFVAVIALLSAPGRTRRTRSAVRPARRYMDAPGEAEAVTPVSNTPAVRQPADTVETVESMPCCPACRAPLAVMPKRKTACPACGAAMYVRSVSPGGSKILLTAEQVADAESRSRALGAQRLRDLSAAQFGLAEGLSEEMFRVALQDICTNGHLPAHRRKVAASMLAGRVDEPRQRLRWARLMHQLEIAHFIEGGYVKRVRVSAPQNCCPWCKQIDGRTMPLHEAYASNLLPYEACANWKGWRPCCCYWSAVVEGWESKV